MSHISMSHVTHTRLLHVKHIWLRLSHVTHTWLFYLWVMSHINMSHVTHTQLLRLWVMSHKSMSHVTHTWLPHATRTWLCMSHVTQTWLFHLWVMSHIRPKASSYKCATHMCVWQMCDMCVCVTNAWHVFVARATGLVCDMTHSYESCHIWNGSCHTCERVMSHARPVATWHKYYNLTQILDVCAWGMSHKCLTYLSRTCTMGLLCDTTHSHESCHVWNESCHTCEWVMSHIRPVETSTTFCDGLDRVERDREGREPGGGG